MEELLFYVVACAGFGAMWLQRRRLTRKLLENRPRLSTDADVVLHLARHEAAAHSTGPGPVHLLYALAADDGIADAIRRAGGDPQALEDRLFTAVQKAEPAHPDEAGRVLGWAMFHARQGDREITTTDLWGGLVRTAPATAELVAAAGVSAASVLFTLVHGTADDVPIPERADDVDIILVNDDITAMDLVTQILQDVFDLPEDRAVARTRETHEQGASTLGRFPVADAARRARRARDTARAKGFPLRFKLQPATPAPAGPGR